MCCCGKPVINGEFGFKWQPRDTPSIHPIYAPELSDGDVLLYDEPGRCGGLDCHSHHFRVVKNCGPVLLVMHGGGQERFRIFSQSLKILEALDPSMRYWALHAIYSAHTNGASDARKAESYKWREATAEKRIKTRHLPKRGIVKVWIEPKPTTIQDGKQ